jgi:hypothetical protein
LARTRGGTRLGETGDRCVVMTFGGPDNALERTLRYGPTI